MGFLGKMFGGGSPETDMYKLLSGPSTEMADEMERIYRGQIDVYCNDFGEIKLSARGILKARLFGASFMLVLHSLKWKDERHLIEMMNATSGLGMLPFESKNYTPKISQSDAASFTSRYIKDVFMAIVAEVKQGPSTPGNQGKGFTSLAHLWVDALMESVGTAAPATDIYEKYYPMIAGGINANMNHMLELKQSL